ncbi:MAG: hypothetical protein EOO60_02350 [Hymenobacter sp.]|nr:MAG: hypothetical protein EOO60_02350 [Hymenobacter sp.]
MSVRAFSTAIGVSDTNTRNYLDRGSKPNTDYIEKVLRRFNDTNPTWLLLGQGEPFLSDTPHSGEVSTTSLKNNYGNTVGNNKGTVSQQVTHSNDTEKLHTALALAQQEIENLRTQLAMKDVLITAKDQVIGVLQAVVKPAN